MGRNENEAAIKLAMPSVAAAGRMPAPAAAGRPRRAVMAAASARASAAGRARPAGSTIRTAGIAPVLRLRLRRGRPHRSRAAEAVPSAAALRRLRRSRRVLAASRLAEALPSAGAGAPLRSNRAATGFRRPGWTVVRRRAAHSGIRLCAARRSPRSTQVGSFRRTSRALLESALLLRERNAVHRRCGSLAREEARVPTGARHGSRLAVRKPQTGIGGSDGHLPAH